MKTQPNDHPSRCSPVRVRTKLLKGTRLAVIAAVGCIVGAHLSSEPHASFVDDRRGAVAKAIPLLQSSAKTWHEKRQCSSCHHQSLGTMAVVIARDRGFRIDEAMLADEVLRSATPAAWRDRLLLGDVSINEQIGRSYEAVAMGAAKVAANPITDLLAHMLMGKQHVNGNWNSYSHRPPLEDSEFTATALTIRAVQLYAPPHRRTEAARRIDRARRWLANAVPRSSEERAMKLFGLRWAGAAPRQVASARDAILRDQRTDGGWAQITTRASDAYATGQALAALNQAAGLPVSDRAYQRGVEFLLRTQHPDGSWLVETRRTRSPGLPYFETGFPHGKHQFISYAATAWATMALALSTDGSPTKALIGHAPESSPPSPARQTDPLTTLMHAAINGSVEEVDREIRNGADVNATTKFGMTALMCAVHDPAKVRLVLKAGANPNAEARSGHTALVLAAGYDGADESVRLLLDAGAKINATVREGIIPGATPLVRAAMRGDLAMAKLLLDRGAALESGEPKTGIALLLAAAQGDVPMVRLLLDRGALVDSRFPKEIIPPAPTALMIAADDGYPEIVRLLLSRGASVNARDYEGVTPLMWAAGAIDRGDTRIIEALLAAGADPAVRTPAGETAHTFATLYGYKAAALLLERASARRAR